MQPAFLANSAVHLDLGSSLADVAGEESLPNELISRALTQSGCGAIITDTEGKILFVNPRVSELTGYSPEELVGRNPRVFQSGATSKGTYLALWNTISSGRTWRGVLQNKKKSGELYWEAITISPVCAATGEITNFSAIIEDITAEKMIESLEAQLEEESRQLQKHESLTALSMGIPHDLNNVLARMITGCELLSQYGNDSARGAELVQIIRQAGEKGVSVVKRFVECSHYALPSVATVDLRELIKRNLQYYDEAVGPGILLSWEPERGPCLMQGNARLVHQAVLALLVNAKEVSPIPGCISLATGTVKSVVVNPSELVLRCGLTFGPAVYVEVADAGEGMDEETLKKAFDPFFSTRPGRRGLGLASVYGIMQGHAGLIVAQSVKGRGTRIRLYFSHVNQNNENVS